MVSRLLAALRVYYAEVFDMCAVALSGDGQQHAVQPIIEPAADEPDHSGWLLQLSPHTAAAQHHSPVTWQGVLPPSNHALLIAQNVFTCF